jgi:hypothetical protein
MIFKLLYRLSAIHYLDDFCVESCKYLKLHRYPEIQRILNHWQINTLLRYPEGLGC